MNKNIKLQDNIYLDYQATTPLDPRVLSEMMPYFNERFGNPPRNHKYGWEAEESIEIAREQVAKIINANPKEVIFASGATESNNIAIKGVADFYKSNKNHIITCVTDINAFLNLVDNCQTMVLMLLICLLIKMAL